LCDLEKGWRRLALVLLACAAFAWPSCKNEKLRRKGPIDFVPSEAEVIVVLDYGGLVKNDVLRKVFDVSEVERSLLAAGISPGNVVSAAGFVKVNLPALTARTEGTPGENPGEFAIIVQVKGGFRPVLEALSENGWVRREYERMSYWAAPGEKVAAASLQGDMLVTGSPAAVQQTIDVAVGKALGAMEPGSESKSGAILRRIGMRGEINVAISFSREIRMAAKDVSQSAGVFRGMTGANMLLQLFDLLGTGRGIGMSFKGTEKGIASRLVFAAGNAASAKAVAGLVRIAKIMIPVVGDIREMGQAAEVVRGLNVASENDLVLIDFKIPVSILTSGAR